MVPGNISRTAFQKGWQLDGCQSLCKNATKFVIAQHKQLSHSLLQHANHWKDYAHFLYVQYMERYYDKQHVGSSIGASEKKSPDWNSNPCLGSHHFTA